MSSPKETRKAFKCWRRGENCLLNTENAKQPGKNGAEMQSGSSVPRYSERVLLNMSPHRPCCISPPSTPSAWLLSGPSGSTLSPNASHLTETTCPTAWSSSISCWCRAWVSWHGGIAFGPLSPQGALRSPQASSLTRAPGHSFPQRPPKSLAWSCLGLSSKLLNHGSVWGKTKLPLTSGITGYSLNYSWI